MFFLAMAALVLWLLVFLLPWRPWWVTESWDVKISQPEVRLDDLTVLIPARNEEEVLFRTLNSVLGQGTGLSVIVINDQSHDATSDILKSSTRCGTL